MLLSEACLGGPRHVRLVPARPRRAARGLAIDGSFWAARAGAGRGAGDPPLGRQRRPVRSSPTGSPSISIPAKRAVARVFDAAHRRAAKARSPELESFVKTTGGKGLHVVFPLMPEADWDTVKSFAESFAPGWRPTFPTSTPPTWPNAPGAGGFSICEIPAAPPPSPPIRPAPARARRCRCRSPGTSFLRFGPEKPVPGGQPIGPAQLFAS